MALFVSFPTLVLLLAAYASLASHATIEPYPLTGPLMCESHGYRLPDETKKSAYMFRFNGLRTEFDSFSDSFKATSMDSSPHSNVTENCGALLDAYGERAQNFVGCSLVRAKPVCLCEACIHTYTMAIDAYTNITTASRHCEKRLLESDRVQVLQRMHTYITSLWGDASCSACFNGHGQLANSSVEFYQRLNTTIQCFRLYYESWSHISHPNKTLDDDTTDSEEQQVGGSALLGNDKPRPAKLYGNLSACQSCRGVYEALQAYYDDMRDKNRVCLDLQDQMNMTREEWGNVFDCSDYDYTRSLTQAVLTGAAGLIVIIAFSAVAYHRGSSKRTTQTASLVNSRRSYQRI